MVDSDDRRPRVRSVARVALIRRWHMCRRLPGCSGTTRLRVTIGALRRCACEDAIAVAGLAFRKAVRALEAEPCREMVEGHLGYGVGGDKCH